MDKLKKYYSTFSLLSIGILLNIFYIRTRSAGFVFDMTEWLYDYANHSNFNVFHPPFDNNLRPVYHFILYNTYKFFGLSTKAWYILSLGLFYLSICFFYVFILKVYKLFGIHEYLKLSYLTTLAVALSPFASEIIVWYATIHYSIVFSCLFCILALIIHYRDSPSKISFLCTIIFSIAILSIELAYAIIPICIGLFVLLIYFKQTKTHYKKFALYIFLPQLCIFCIYNLINFFCYDKFLGHYDIEKVDFGVIYLLIHYIKLLIKHITFINYCGQNIYESFYNFIDNYAYTAFISSLIMLGLIAHRYYSRRSSLNPLEGLVAFFLFSSFCLYIPISFLFFHNWKEIELDRLGYGTMIFIIALVFLIVWHLDQKIIRISFYYVFFTLSILLLLEYTSRWEKSAIVRKNFSQNLPILENKKVYLIAAPIVLKYAYLITINDSLELRRHLKIFHNAEPRSQYQILGFYNMIDIDDMVSVKKLGDSSLNFRVEKWGAWCWFNLKSAIKSYENDQYRIVADSDHLGYSVHFKSLDSNTKLFLFNKLNFKEVKLSQNEIGHIFL